MSLTYPQNVVWYIEARPWSGTKEAPGEAHADPESMGSGVVIWLGPGERTWGDPLTTEPRKYLLTCAHVVRRRSDDALLEEIVCFPPGFGYVRTEPGSRQCGKFPNSYAKVAKVSELSPCRGILGARAGSLRNAHDDWVLLDISDPKFQAEECVANCTLSLSPEIGNLLVIGYPGGAGTLLEKEKAQRKGPDEPVLFWKSGRPVLPAPPEDFKLHPHAEPGMLEYSGADTRPGMSGGGLFDQAGNLVGIHRSYLHAAMSRGAIRASYIMEWLQGSRKLKFLPGLSGRIDTPEVNRPDDRAERFEVSEDSEVFTYFRRPGRCPHLVAFVRSDGGAQGWSSLPTEFTLSPAPQFDCLTWFSTDEGSMAAFLNHLEKSDQYKHVLVISHHSAIGELTKSLTANMDATRAFLLDPASKSLPASATLLLIRNIIQVGEATVEPAVQDAFREAVADFRRRILPTINIETIPESGKRDGLGGAEERKRAGKGENPELVSHVTERTRAVFGNEEERTVATISLERALQFDGARLMIGTPQRSDVPKNPPPARAAPRVSTDDFQPRISLADDKRIQLNQFDAFLALLKGIAQPVLEAPALLILTGEAGTGKSMVLRELARHLATQHLNGPFTASPLPITIPLQQFKVAKGENLWASIVRSWLAWGNSLAGRPLGQELLTTDWLDRRFRRQPTVLILDSIDEFLMNHPFVTPEAFRSAVLEMRQEYGDSRHLSIIFGIRSTEPILRHFAGDATTVMQLRQMDVTQAREYFPGASPALDRIDPSSPVAGLLLTPLLLSVLDNVVASDVSDQVFATDASIIELALRTQIKAGRLNTLQYLKHNQIEPTKLAITVEDCKNMLTMVALLFSTKRLGEMTDQEIAAGADTLAKLWSKHEWPEGRGEADVEIKQCFELIADRAITRTILRRSVFFPTRSSAFRFQHRLWQDYLFGRYLAIAIDAQNLNELTRGAFTAQAMKFAGQILEAEGWHGITRAFVEKLRERMKRPQGQWVLGNIAGVIGNQMIQVDSNAADVFLECHSEMPKAAKLTFVAGLGTRILRHEPGDHCWADLLRVLLGIMKEIITAVRTETLEAAEGHDRVTASLCWCLQSEFAATLKSPQYSPTDPWPGLNLTIKQEREALNTLLAEWNGTAFGNPLASEYQTVQSAYLFVQPMVPLLHLHRPISAVHYLYMLCLAIKHKVAIEELRTNVPALLHPDNQIAKVYASHPIPQVGSILEACRALLA